MFSVSSLRSVLDRNRRRRASGNKKIRQNECSQEKLRNHGIWARW